MSTRLPVLRSTRRAFTLIELLVVISLIIAISSIILVLVPGVNDQRAVTRGADQVQGWLLIAKQRARRDVMPCGIRIVVDSATSTAKELQYIIQPDDYAPAGAISGSVYPKILAPAGSSVVFSNIPLVTIQQFLLAGDVLVISDTGNRYSYIITGIGGNTAAPSMASQFPTQLNLLAAVEPATLIPVTYQNSPDGKQFRFVRQPKPVVGEDSLQIPVNVQINTASGGSLNLPPSKTTANAGQTWYDIVFSPSGQVINTGSGRIVVWIEPTAGTVGVPTLLTIYTRSGLIVAHPRADGADPYQYTYDGLDSGL